MTHTERHNFIGKQKFREPSEHPSPRAVRPSHLHVSLCPWRVLFASRPLRTLIRESLSASELMMYRYAASAISADVFCDCLIYYILFKGDLQSMEVVPRPRRIVNFRIDIEHTAYRTHVSIKCRFIWCWGLYFYYEDLFNGWTVRENKY